MKSIYNLFLPLNVHLLLGVTLFFIAGIISAAFAWPYYYNYAIVALFLSINGVQNYIKKTVTLTFLVLTISFTLGHIRYHQQCSPYQLFFAQYPAISYNLTGEITNITPIEHARAKQCITLHINQIQKNIGVIYLPTDKTVGAIAHRTTQSLDNLSTQSFWQPISIYLQIYSTDLNLYQVADTIQINNITIKKPSGESYFNYLIKEGITATIFYSHNDSLLLDRPAHSMLRWIFTTKKNIFDRLRNKMNSESFTLFSSLFLGNRTINKKKIDILADQFKQWGISHYLARSGLHLTTFALIWHLIFRLLPIAFHAKQMILLMLSIIYFTFSWSSISFLRALYSFFLCTLCNLLSIRAYFLHILTLVTFFVLFSSPIQLFFLDFQLSFSLTFSLAWISHLYQSKKI